MHLLLLICWAVILFSIATICLSVAMIVIVAYLTIKGIQRYRHERHRLYLRSLIR